MALLAAKPLVAKPNVDCSLFEVIMTSFCVGLGQKGPENWVLTYE